MAFGRSQQRLRGVGERIAPTPWVSTNQPSSVSIGEPQLPSWMISQGWQGVWITSDVFQQRRSSENAIAFVSLSDRDSAT